MNAAGDMEASRQPASGFKLQSIDLYITSACNRRCTYCFLSDTFLSSTQYMPITMIDNIACWALDQAVSEITLLGGEPARHPKFCAIVPRLADCGLAVRTVTNGSPSFRSALTEIGGRFDRVAVSLDTFDARVFDANRGRGAFRDALSTVEALKAQSIPLEINITVLRSTADQLAETLHYVELLGAQRANIHWFSPVGRGRKYAAGESLTAAEWRDIVKVASSYSPRRADFIVDCELGYSYGMPGEDLKMCAVRDGTNLQFLPSGSVLSCGMLIENEELSGYIWEDGKLKDKRADETERTLTATPTDGCPLRSNSSSGGTTPLCIYNRLARH